ncbi:hypothetical protein, partial [Kibdelosporangium philippinense]|uniref:hypothetical protein n=1 Tax=Kibdelosporangium philippinense TaxID=211113 RepID=UPI00360E846F
MRKRTVGLLVAGAAVMAGTVGGVAWASTADEPTPSVRIVQQEQPTQPDQGQTQPDQQQQQPRSGRDCPEKNGGNPAPAPRRPLNNRRVAPGCGLSW